MFAGPGPDAAPLHAASSSVTGAAAGAATRGGPTPSTKAARGFVFFSDRLRAATGDALTIAFTPDVLASISPELEKVRAARQQARQRAYPSDIRRHLDGDAYKRLRTEATHRFDTARYPLARAFCEMLGLDGPLDQLHHSFHGDLGERLQQPQHRQGRSRSSSRSSCSTPHSALCTTPCAPVPPAVPGVKGARREKAKLLAPLTQPDSRATLEHAYEALVLEQARCVGFAPLKT